MHSTCTWSHIAGAYTLSFFKIRGRTVQPCLSHFGLTLDSPTIMSKGCTLLPDILLYFSSAQRLKIWIKCTSFNTEQLVGVVFAVHGALHHRGKQCPCLANLPLFTHWFSSICCRGEDLWCGRCSPGLKIFIGFPIWGRTTIHIIEDQGLVSGTATKRS